MTLKTLNAFPSSIIRIEVDPEELRWYVKGVFEEEYGINSVAKVETAQYDPYTIRITVYVKEEKAEMRDLCVQIAHVLRSEGVRASLRTEITLESA